MKRNHWVVAALALVAAGLAAWGAVAATAASKRSEATKVTLQLKWVTQAQFAGYYAASAKGFYKQAGLDVKIKVGGPSITPELVVAGKQAEFGIDWLPALLAARDKGGDLVNVAQVFTRSGMTELTWRDSGITSIAKMRGKKVGVWCCGNENELYAALVKNGIDPKNPKDITIVNQPFNMDLLLQRQVDAAAAKTYNELAQVLETKNPKTGQLYTLKDLNVITMEKAGTGMLEDGIFVRGDWLKDKANQETTRKFLEASFRGWVYCRDHRVECTTIVLKNGSLLGKGHQTWQMNEINALIWPVKQGVGVMDKAAYARTAKIAKQFGVIKKAASGAYVDTYAKQAVARLKQQGVDVNGTKWKKAVVKVTPGGK